MVNWEKVYKMVCDSSVKIDSYPEVKTYTDKELQEIYKTIVDADVQVDQHSELEEQYETQGEDWNLFKIAIEDEFKRRGIVPEV